eukprot:2261103-Ditylum_brightwellii.AAC.1
MGVLPDEVNGFADIDPRQLYNIDEVSIDTIKRCRIRVLGGPEVIKQCLAFRRTFEGDNKMTKHITVMLCSRSDGAYCHPGNSDDGYEEHGAIPPYIVHSSKGKNKPDK